MSDIAALFIAAGIAACGMLIGLSVECGLKAIAEAITKPKRYDVSLPSVKVIHDREGS